MRDLQADSAVAGGKAARAARAARGGGRSAGVRVSEAGTAEAGATADSKAPAGVPADVGLGKPQDGGSGKAGLAGRGLAGRGLAGRGLAGRGLGGRGLAGDQPAGPSLAAGHLPVWLVAVIPALAELVVGGYRISGPSFWRDEAATISGSQRPIGAIFALMRHQDAVHGPYYLLMHAVIAAAGTSETALRLPSLVAMCLAVGLTAVLGRRLALATAIPAPGVTGIGAALLLTAVPLTTRYAQEGRPYAITSLFVVLATYLFVRAAARSRWQWWAGYAAALVLTGWFNMFAVLIAVAHGISLIVARRTARSGQHAGAGSGEEVRPDASAAPGAGAARGAGAALAPDAPLGWLIASVAAAVVLSPLAYFSLSQSAQLGWVAKPDPSTVASLIRDFSGTTALILPVIVLGLVGCAAGLGLRRKSGLSLPAVTLPWLVVPPVLLMAVSFAKPVYVERYVLFCLPALSLLVAAGLVWLVTLTWRFLEGRGLAGPRARLLAFVPSGVLVLVMLVALVGPQAAIRLSSARADNLRALAVVIAAHERPGDAILYMPWDTAVVGMAYPGPFSRLNSIELGETPLRSDTLRGLPAPPSLVAERLAEVTRVWTVQWAAPLPAGAPGPADRFAMMAVSRMRLVHRWRIASVVLSLYSAR